MLDHGNGCECINYISFSAVQIVKVLSLSENVEKSHRFFEKSYFRENKLKTNETCFVYLKEMRYKQFLFSF